MITSPEREAAFRRSPHAGASSYDDALADGQLALEERLARRAIESYLQSGARRLPDSGRRRPPDFHSERM